MVYRHTQTAWFTLGATAAMIALVLAGTRDMMSSAAANALWLLAGIPVLLYGWMTVVVDEVRFRVSFGIGFIHRTVPLDRIRGWREVRNTVANGIGVRFVRGGMLYNVRPGRGVELLLENGRVLRVGTPEPDLLMAALARVHTPPVPDYPLVAATVRPARWRVAVPVVMAIAFGLFAFDGLRRAQQPRVVVSPTEIVITSLLHEERVPVALLTAATLEEQLPSIRRPSLLTFGGRLRGRFLLAGTGQAAIFADRNHPPFIHLRTRGDHVIVGFRDGSRTRAVYDEVRRVYRGN